MISRQWALEKSITPNDFESWLSVCKEIDASILQAGLGLVSGHQNIDFNSVTELPINNEFVLGSNKYQFEDSFLNESPVVLEIEFGVGCSGSVRTSSADHGRGMTPRFRWRVYMDDNAGDWFYCPQEYEGDGINNTLATQKGWSIYTYHPDGGFFGFVYGIGSVGSPYIYQNQVAADSMNNMQGAYCGAYLTIFIQRSLDGSLQPTGHSVIALGPNQIIATSSESYQANGGQKSALQVVSKSSKTDKIENITQDLGVHRKPIINRLTFFTKEGGVINFPYLLTARQSAREAYLVDTDMSGMFCRFISIGANCGIMYGSRAGNSSTLMAVEILP